MITGYQIEEEVGAGGFGIVYRARQSSAFDREVAIKVILPRYANEPDFIRRFESEAQLISRLEHPHVVPLHDYWRDPDGAYLVMRWLRGGSLKDAIQHQPLDLESASQIMDQVCAGLTVAHQQDVIHRDIKPSNILLDEYGNAYLADFGIAKNLTNFGDMTQPDAIVGSPGYLAPEQARGEIVSPRTDVYSLGVTLYEMLAGQHPFADANNVEKLYKHLNEALPLLVCGLEPDIEAQINEIIQKATAKNPAERYESAIAFAQTFREAAQVGQPSTESIVGSLSIREQEILQGIMEGKNDKELANDLFISVNTVRWYLRQIYKKLNVRSRVQAVAKARELELIISTDTPLSVGEPTVATYYTLPEPENPYKGLKAFTAADANDFFGREKLTAKLLKRLDEDHEFKRFLAVIGPSGSGKSSLVKAGLIPAIWRGEVPGSDDWFVIDMLPGTHPLDELEIALTRVAADQSQNLKEHLQRDERGLVRVGQLILPDDGSELLVVIDQFEELFTLVEDDARREHFLKLLCTATTDPRSRVRIVITLRADFYDRPLQYPQLGEMLRQRMETILPLSAEELERAVVQPARRVGVKFADGLVSAIVGDVNYQPGSLPLLQYALTELFEQRDDRLIKREAYQAIGGTVGALARRADEIFSEFTEEGQHAIRQMFLRLVTLGEGTEDTRRRVPRSELLAVANSNEDLMDDVINTFTDYRLLALDHDPITREPTVEVAHEAILREWERLRGWLNDSRDDIKQQRQLAALTAEWEAHQRSVDFLVRGSRLGQFQVWSADTELSLTPSEQAFLAASIADREQRHAEAQAQTEREAHLERRARRVLQGLVAVLLVAAVLATGLALFAFDERSAAQDARAVSDANAVLAQERAEQSQASFLASAAEQVLENGDTDLAIALAVEAYHLAPDARSVKRALADVASTGGTQSIFADLEGEVSALAVSRDHRLLVTGTRQSGVVTLWDFASRQKLNEWQVFRGEIYAVDISPDNRLIAVGGLLGTISISLINIDLGTTQSLRPWTDFRTLDLQFSPDGQRLISSSLYGIVELWDTTSGQILQRVHEGQLVDISYIAFSPDGQTVAYLLGAYPRLANTTQLYVVRDAHTLDLIRREPLGDAGSILSMTQDGRFFVSRTLHENNRITLQYTEVSTGQLRGEVSYNTVPSSLSIVSASVLNGAKSAINKIDTHIVVENQDMLLIDTTTGTLKGRLRGHRNGITDTVFIDDNHLLSAGGGVGSGATDLSLRLWDVVTGKTTAVLSGTSVLTPSGDMILTGFPPIPFDVDRPPDRPSLYLADVHTGQKVRDIAFDVEGIPYNAVFSPDGRYVAVAAHVLSEQDSGYTNYTIFTWPDLGFVSRVVVPNYDLAPSFSLDGTRLATGEVRLDGYFRFHRARVWDVASGQLFQITRQQQHRYVTFALDLSAQGQVLAGGRGDSTIDVLTVDGQTPDRAWALHEGVVESGVLNADQTRLLTGDVLGTVILSDPVSQELIHRYKFHEGGVGALAFAPDGRRAVSGDATGQIVMWNLETGDLLHVFTGHTGTIRRLQFTPDGRYLMSSSEDDTTRIWDVPPYETAEEISAWLQNNRYIPEFTCEQREQFNITPLCSDPDQVVETHTPAPTLTPSATPTLTLTPNLTRTTATPTNTPSATPTLTPTIPTSTPLSTIATTPLPTAEAVQQGMLESGVAVRGVIQGGLSRPYTIDAWLFESTPGQDVTLRFTHTGLKLVVIDPDGDVALESTDATIGPIALEKRGTYQIHVTGDLAPGPYSLRITPE